MNPRFSSFSWLNIIFTFIYVCVGFPGGASGKGPTCQCLTRKRPETWVQSLRREIPGEGNGNPLTCSRLENPMDRSLVGYSLYGLKELDTTEVT